MSIMKDESFGPVIGIQVVNSEEEALSLMNETTYRLPAGVYTPDQSAAMYVSNPSELLY
mgnify:CR=1 FL=1